MHRVHKSFHAHFVGPDLANWILLLSALAIIVLSLVWALFFARPLPGT